MLILVKNQFQKCHPGHTCTLVPEPDNPYDKNAIKVMRDSHHIGYLNKRFAEVATSKMKKGYHYKVVIKNITGGTKSKPTMGVNLEIAVSESKPKSGCLLMILIPMTLYAMLTL